MLSRHDSFHRTNAVPWLRSRRSYDAGFFSCWTRKEQISRRGVMACRNSTSLSFPERNRGAGMILPRQIAALHAFNLGHGCKGALAIEGSRLKLTSPADLP